MAWADWIIIVVLGLLWGAQILLRSFEFSIAKTDSQKSHFFIVTFWTVVLMGFGFAAYDAEMQYLAWAQGGIGKYLLQNIGYFWFYVGERFFAPWLIALLAALLVGAAAEWMNKKYDERFFETEEFPLLKIGFFLAGYPGFFFYLMLVLFVELIFSAFRTLFRRERAPIYFLWLPLAILAIILRGYFIPSAVLSSFNL